MTFYLTMDDTLEDLLGEALEEIDKEDDPSSKRKNDNEEESSTKVEVRLDEADKGKDKDMMTSRVRQTII